VSAYVVFVDVVFLIVLLFAALEQVKQGQQFAAPFHEKGHRLATFKREHLPANVQEFETYIMQPMPLPVGYTACAGWVESTQPQPQAMFSNVTSECHRVALDSANRLHVAREVFLRGTLDPIVDQRTSINRNARSEHTVDMTTQSHLVLTAWRDVMATDLGRLLCYASDQPLQGVVHNVALLRLGKEGNVYRWNEKPDGCLLVPFTKYLSLLVNLETKSDDTESDEAKAERTAEMQFYFLKEALKNTTLPVLAPFITIEGDTVALYLVAAVEGAPNDSPQTCTLYRFDVSKRDEATQLLAVMYRLADWMAKYSTNVVENVSRDACGLQLIGIDKASSRSFSGSKSPKPGKSSSVNDGKNNGVNKPLLGSNVALSGWFEGLQRVGKRGNHVASRTVWVKLWSVEDEKLARAEAEALEALAGPGVPRLLGQKVFGNVLAVAMERCGKPVRHVKSWSELCSIAEQVAKTLCRVHQLGWVHGDVKPSNILQDDNGQVKVSDWEGATKIGRIPRRYSEGFRAPETLAKHDAVFVDRSDVFSLGRTLQIWASGLSRKWVPVWWAAVEAGTTAHDVNVRWSAQQLEGVLRDARGSPGSSPNASTE
jgi:hypothetical protein